MTDRIEALYRAAAYPPESFSYAGPDACLAAVEDLAARLPAAAGAAIRDKVRAFAAAGASDYALWKGVRDLITQAAAQGMGDLITTHNARLTDAPFAAFAEALAGAGDRTVLFVANKPYFAILRQALHLKDQGWRPFLACVEPIPADLAAPFADAFGAVVDCHGNMGLVGRLLGRLRPAVIHVQCWMWSYHLARLVMEQARGVPVVCEFYDVTSCYAPRDALVTNWPADRVDLDLAMEGHILRHADAVITRFVDPVPDVLRQRHGAPDARILRFWPYPCPAFSHLDPVDRPSATDGVLRLVYAGGVFPLAADHPPGLFPGFGQLGAIRRLLAQGLKVDVLHDPHRPVEPRDPSLKDYYDLMDAGSGFRIMNGVGPDRVAERLAAYDFGLILFDLYPDRMMVAPELLRDGIGTKLFTYLEAGLPILVNAEYEAMARLIEDNGLGLAVTTADIGAVAPRLRAADPTALAANVRAYCREHGMDRHIGELTGVYEAVMG
ncbi:MAG: hypothetical protein KDE22_15340 [Rhodobacterales bacterium]|nr:hypothetical protein [Rhodobacterales bacterium]